MRELLRVTQENQDILRRITVRRPVYNHQKWEQDWNENQQFMDNISSYPKDWWKPQKVCSSGRHKTELLLLRFSQIVWKLKSWLCISGICLCVFHHYMYLYLAVSILFMSSRAESRVQPTAAGEVQRKRGNKRNQLRILKRKTQMKKIRNQKPRSEIPFNILLCRVFPTFSFPLNTVTECQHLFPCCHCWSECKWVHV